ncbi:MAG: hypothetical protein JNJ77_10515 [Planctomycetia bacterium]|nr:hypothetical protein [Planctomycetia bacterium]
MQHEAYRKLRRHPQCRLLSQVAAIGFCRNPVFWQHIPDTGKELLEAGLLCALELITTESLRVLVVREKQSLQTDLALVFGKNADPSKVNGHAMHGKDLALKAVEVRNHFAGKRVGGLHSGLNPEWQYLHYLAKLHSALSEVPALLQQKVKLFSIRRLT